MKNGFLFCLILGLGLNLKAQVAPTPLLVTYDSLCTDFDSTATFVRQLSGSWQIGQVHKTVFNDALSPFNSIVTDTLNPYPNNDSAVFYAVYAPTEFYNYLYYYFPFSIEFAHRYNTDTLSDFGILELSIDGGLTWIDGLSPTFEFYEPGYNYDIHLNTNDTTTGYNTITGNSNGWIHTRITKDLDSWNSSIHPTGFFQIDSVMVRFTFRSDSINNNKDGWQIDNLCLKPLVFTPIEANVTTYGLNLSPNPCSDQTLLTSNKALNDATLRIYNAFGQEVKQINHINGQSINIQRDGLGAGIYFIQLSQDYKTYYLNKLVIIDN